MRQSKTGSNANILTAQLMTNPGDLGMKMTQYYQQNPGSLDNWFDAISSDSLYLSDPWFQQSGFVNQLENTLVQFGDMAAQDKANLKGTPRDEEGFYGFATWWSNGLTLVQQLSSGTQLATISYYSDPVAFLDAIPGYGAMDTALSLVDNWDIIGTGSVLNVDVNSYSESTAPAIKRQELRTGQPPYLRIGTPGHHQVPPRSVPPQLGLQDGHHRYPGLQQKGMVQYGLQ